MTPGQPGQYGAQAPAAGPKKMSVGLIIGLVVGGIILLCCISGVVVALIIGAKVSDNNESDSAPPVPGLNEAEARSVRYEVNGGGKLTFLTYSDGRSGHGPKSGESLTLPWSAEVPCCDDFDYAVVAVPEGGLTGGPLTCRILVDGTQVDEETASGSVSCRWLPDR